MELTPRGLFTELNRLPWGKFSDKQRSAAMKKFCDSVHSEMKKAGIRVEGGKMTDAERREELVSFFDEKLKNRELTASEVREMVSLCGLDKRTQDITLEIVDFSLVDWESEEPEVSVETESKQEELDADTSPTA